MQKRIFKVARHSLVWLFFLGLPYLLYYELFEITGFSLIKVAFSSPFYWIFSAAFILLFYSNLYYFIPKLYLRKKYTKYTLSILLLFIGFYVLKPFDFVLRYHFIQIGRKVRPYNVLELDLFSITFFIIIITVTMVVLVIRQWRATEMRALQAEAEKAHSELSFLKAQINPHFLFNTLNNIYSLSIDQHPDTSASIMKLSNIMRYITDDATKDYVSLENEIAIIRDYIDLQQLRHSNNVRTYFSVNGNIADKQIAPLILMTYIENAFKYGISSHEEALITIRLFADESHINFFCQNGIFAIPRVTERTGIGLVNTKQRLTHLYHNKHNLTITSENGLYTVDLTLET